MARADVRGGGIQVEGLSETIRALGKWDKAARKEAVEIFRDEAKAVQSAAKARAPSSHPGAPSNTAWIGRSATGTGAGVSLLGAKNGRAAATEWGMHTWHIPRKRGGSTGYVQSALRRRIFKPWVGNQFDVKGGTGPGYVIQTTIRRHLPGMEDRVADKLQALLVRELNKAGVPRG
jgi:hypothetical protein